jgi:hypothetical protein
MSDRLDLLNLLWPHGPRRKRRAWRPPWDEQPDDPRGSWDEQPDDPNETWDEKPPPRRRPGMP